MSEFGANIPRVIFIGHSGVGKTSIIHRAKFGNFESHTVPTIGAGTTQMNMNVNGKEVEYQLWDTAGQEIYRNIVPIYFKGAVGAVVTFSMTDVVSFQSLQSWIDQLTSHAEPNTQYVIVGNKCDAEKPTVDEMEAREWAQRQGLSIFFTSALTGENIDLLKEFIESKFVAPAFSIVPSVISPIPKKSRGCC
jgi:small GTP-binding protein